MESRSKDVARVVPEGSVIMGPPPPSYLLSIDPGKHLIAWAAWADSELIGCGLARMKQGIRDQGVLAVELAKQLPTGVEEIVIEGMAVQHDRTHDPADMLAVQAVGSFVAGWLHPERIHWTRDTEWKGGSITKDIQWGRDYGKLFPIEKRIVNRAVDAMSAPSLAHNMYDAIGIGLWWLRKKRRKGYDDGTRLESEAFGVDRGARPARDLGGRALDRKKSRSLRGGGG